MPECEGAHHAGRRQPSTLAQTEHIDLDLPPEIQIELLKMFSSGGALLQKSKMTLQSINTFRDYGVDFRGQRQNSLFDCISEHYALLQTLTESILN